MISRSEAFSPAEPAVVGGPDDDPVDASAGRAVPTTSPPVRSGGTQLLVDAFERGRGGWVTANPTKARSVVSEPSDPVAASLEKAIRDNPAYQRLAQGDKAVADWIMWRASEAPPAERQHYLSRLRTLFETRADPKTKEQLAIECNAKVDLSLALEPLRANAFEHEEEQASAGAVLSTRIGIGGTIYRVDARDPQAVVVKVKIHLVGERTFVAKLKGLEDAIEKRAATHGYTLDVEFVDKRGVDVFTIKADPREWPSSVNMVGGPETLAHEIHHLLGLEDRYDYIERHADNPNLPIDQRLYLFARQMQKAPDPRGDASLMARAGRLLSEDVCAAVQGPQKECIDARKKFDPPGLPAHPVRGPHHVH